MLVLKWGMGRWPLEFYWLGVQQQFPNCRRDPRLWEKSPQMKRRGYRILLWCELNLPHSSMLPFCRDNLNVLQFQLGALMAVFPTGYLADRFGKTIMLISGIPILIGWIIMGLSHSVGLLLFGRFIAGRKTCVSLTQYVWKHFPPLIYSNKSRIFRRGIVRNCSTLCHRNCWNENPRNDRLFFYTTIFYWSIVRVSLNLIAPKQDYSLRFYNLWTFQKNIKNL